MRFPGTPTASALIWSSVCIVPPREFIHVPVKVFGSPMVVRAVEACFNVRHAFSMPLVGAMPFTYSFALCLTAMCGVAD